MSSNDRWTLDVPGWIRSAGIWGGILLILLGIWMLRVRIWGSPFLKKKKRSRSRPRRAQLIVDTGPGAIDPSTPARTATDIGG